MNKEAREESDRSDEDAVFEEGGDNVFDGVEGWGVYDESKEPAKE